MRALLLHRSKFQKNYQDPKFGVCQGALVVYTNGRYWYHDGTTWVPNDGLTCVGFIKLFHCNVPQIEDDEFCIMAGLTNNCRMLNDTWDQQKVRECLNGFLALFPEEYAVWPEGEILQPLAKARVLNHKRRIRIKKVEQAYKSSVSPAPKGKLGGTDRRKVLIGG